MIYKSVFFVAMFASVSLAHAEPCYNPGVVFDGASTGFTRFNDESFNVFDSDGIPTHMMVPDAEGKSFLRIPIEASPGPSGDYLNAQELRLKVRDIATQLLESWDPSSLKGMVAYLTTFTPPFNANHSNLFGQYMRDTLIHEFTMRGMPVQEYRAQNYIEGDGGFSFVMKQEKFNTSVNDPRAAVISGTYYYDKDSIYIIVRMVRGSDGMVLRTAQSTIPMSSLVDRLTSQVYRKPLQSENLKIVSDK